MYEPLCKGDLLAARKAVRVWGGTPSPSPVKARVAKAAVEAVTRPRTTSLPPCSTLFIGGAPLAAYKAINTMDSMVGYKNDKYLYFGRATAKLDVRPYVPARLPALFWTFSGNNTANAWRIWRRDPRGPSTRTRPSRNPPVRVR